VAHTPDFLMDFVVLMDFMRLSSTKAAQAVVAWCRVQEIPGISLVFREMWDSTALSL
jgi:hypothetical protein